jgi:hypothetical protein
VAVCSDFSVSIIYVGREVLNALIPSLDQSQAVLGLAEAASSPLRLSQRPNDFEL